MAHLSKKRIAILGAGGVLALGLAAPAVAYAADSTPSPSTSSSSQSSSSQSSASQSSASQSSSSQSSQSPSSQAGHRGADQGEFAKALAKELGVDEQKVSDALTKVREQLKPQGGDQKSGDRKGDQSPKPDAADRAAKLKERLAQAVKDGKLTQAEADAITKAAEAGVLMGGGGPGHGDAAKSSDTTK
ncbi:hypothetical protein [Hamadaea tsunoensis]|uniref:hypothetical protein n=1 Tax=Hamadaea tsunoensis TaxID=53368 RepID=UPI00042890BF|nr:hypothetical protein [Hamadaea tsunoensis]